ncbi:site-specific integrase [Trichocoleus sp. FACHB-262]|uniref:tyrosine-type recombinase/integrase n=1 Tax=Trichocoleus sp. FACHB-262 TaxID=2692869 RepID=UPI001684BF66|nr:site-specific integrase [Trichocoleus sp. FACHB-262]MBD2123418.1 tyrosine-type recombinase/integrase [Trichocoleus sp. FACHB-262]
MEAIQNWSETKQKNLASKLGDFWARDEWKLSECPIKPEGLVLPKKFGADKKLQFQIFSPSVNTEIKYAYCQKLQKGEWSFATVWGRSHVLEHLTDWLNLVAPHITSLLERSLDRWELSWRSYLAERGILKEPLTPPRIDKQQKERRYRLHSIYVTMFRQIYKLLQKAYDDRTEYEKDSWDLRSLGIFCNPSRSEYKLNFNRIASPWVKQAAKHFIRYSLSIRSGGECKNRITTLISFSDFLSKHHPSAQPADINRSLIVEYLSYLASSKLGANTKTRYISQLRTFLEMCPREGWANVPDKRLIYSEDFPKHTRAQPRFIPEEVMEQLNQNLESLPPHIARMVLILQECGMRIGELCRMPFDCLTRDAHGDYFLRYYQFKLKKEHSIPIAPEVVAVIQEQQQIVRVQRGADFPYLFHNARGKPMKQKVFSDALNRLAYDKQICTLSGTPWHFQSHQFRHTVGTRMVNHGVPQHVIQRFLGHESPEMTAHYACIHDQTMKEKYAEFKKNMVDVTGKMVEPRRIAADIAEGADPNDVDAQWLKKNILAQALPNGLCTLPVVKGACPYGANKCLTCTHFKTDVRYLNQHQEHLERANKLLEWAEEAPDSRRSIEIRKENLPVQENLVRIIAAITPQQGASDET